MREIPPAIADHLDRVRRANRRRPVSVVEAFDLTPAMRRLVLEELEPNADASGRPAGIPMGDRVLIEALRLARRVRRQRPDASATAARDVPRPPVPAPA